MVDHRLYYWSVSDQFGLVRPRLDCALFFSLLLSFFFPFCSRSVMRALSRWSDISVVQYSVVQGSVWHLVSEMLASVPLVLAHTFFVCRWTQLTSFFVVLLIWDFCFSTLFLFLVWLSFFTLSFMFFLYFSQFLTCWLILLYFLYFWHIFSELFFFAAAIAIVCKACTFFQYCRFAA